MAICMQASLDWDIYIKLIGIARVDTCMFKYFGEVVKIRGSVVSAVRWLITLCSLEHESCCLTKAISSRLTKSSTKAIPRVDIKHRGKKISQSSVYTVKSNGKFVIVPRSHHCRSSASLLSWWSIISWVSDGNFQQNPLLAVRTEWRNGPASSRPWTFLWLVVLITQRKAIQSVID